MFKDWHWDGVSLLVHPKQAELNLQSWPYLTCKAFLQKVLGEVLFFLKFAINDFWLQVLLKTPYTGLFLKKECEL